LFADEIKQVESTQSLAEAEAVHGAVAYHYKELREVLKNKKVPIISHALAMELANIIPEEELRGAIIVKEQKIRKIVKAGKKDIVKIISHEIARKAPITDIKDSIAVKESVLEELKKTKKRVKVLTGLPAYLIEGEDAIEHSLVANRVLKNAILISDDSDSSSKRRKNIWQRYVDGIITAKKSEIVPESEEPEKEKEAEKDVECGWKVFNLIKTPYWTLVA